MNEGIQVMRKFEYEKKVKFLCVVGFEKRALYHERSSKCSKIGGLYVQIFHKGNSTNIPESIWQLFWLRLKMKLREWDLDAFKNHFLN